MSCHVSSSFLSIFRKVTFVYDSSAVQGAKSLKDSLTDRPSIKLSCWTAKKVAVILPTTMLQTVMLPLLTHNSQKAVINVLNSIHRHAVASLLSMCHKTSNKPSSAIINIKSVTLSTIISQSQIIHVSTTLVSQ